ncbi:L-histidine N(alpha)-methyltransferase [Candidatus Parcubacteria bacterium]|nr:L-histidine N(alpha)-methyltransferase [Candidatus Parcubacteria bacterium]
MNLTDKQEYELLAAISARGQIPDKFYYLDGGEKLWDAVYKERSSPGGMANSEMKLLLNHLPSFIHPFKGNKGINLIDLGCGNGQPAIPIIQELQKQNFDVIYIAVDISEAMMDLAEKNILKRFPQLKIKKLLIDFEKESLTDELINLKLAYKYPSLLINLGNTLGNYVNVSSVLTNFLESMTLDDYLLVGNGIANEYNPQKIMSSYTTAAHDTVTRPAKLLGLYKDKDIFRWVWNDEKKQVEARIQLQGERQINLAGQKINLEKNEEFMVMKSVKYSEATLTKLLSEVGFRTELLTTTKERNDILALVQPTRYTAI